MLYLSSLLECVCNITNSFSHAPSAAAVGVGGVSMGKQTRMEFAYKP